MGINRSIRKVDRRPLDASRLREAAFGPFFDPPEGQFWLFYRGAEAADSHQNWGSLTFRRTNCVKFSLTVY